MITFGKIKQMIDDKKASFSKAQNDRSAARLQKLKTERVKQEGKARLAKAEISERKRIQDAKDLKKKNRDERIQAITGKFGAPANLKQSKAVPKKESKLGNGFGEGINPAFTIGKK